MPDIKTLYIVRHAKSSWDVESLSDNDRPLKERGIRDAFEIARQLKGKKDVPQSMISSPAIRALHTAIIFSRTLNVPADKIIVSERLLHTDTSEIIDMIRETPEDIGSLMIFGHNPEFTELANLLSNLSLANLPTTGTVKLTFRMNSWEQAAREFLQEETFYFPSGNNKI